MRAIACTGRTPLTGSPDDAIMVVFVAVKRSTKISLLPVVWKTSGTLVAEESRSSMPPSLAPQSWIPMPQFARWRPWKAETQFPAGAAVGGMDGMSNVGARERCAARERHAQS